MISSILNDQIVLFDLQMELKQVLSFPVGVELGVIAMKDYFTFLKAPELEPHHQMV